MLVYHLFGPRLPQSPDEIDLRGLCRTLQSVIDSRPGELTLERRGRKSMADSDRIGLIDASMDTSDLDTTIDSLLLQPRVAIAV